MFVSSAIRSMIEILFRMSCIMATVSRIAAPLSSIEWAPRSAIPRISSLCSALRVMIVFIRSRWASVVWIAADSSRVPPERSCAEPATCVAAALIAAALERSADVTSVNRSVIARKARPKASASERGATRTATFPSPMLVATAAIERR
jgi:hypothetical protein